MVLLGCALLLPSVTTSGITLLIVHRAVMIALLKTAWMTQTVDALHPLIVHVLHIDLVMILLADALHLLIALTLIIIMGVLQLFPLSRQHLRLVS